MRWFTCRVCGGFFPGAEGVRARVWREEEGEDGEPTVRRIRRARVCRRCAGLAG